MAYCQQQYKAFEACLTPSSTDDSRSIITDQETIEWVNNNSQECRIIIICKFIENLHRQV